jgi:ribosomal protein S18 acetylase RimI-like enzyme
MKADGWERFEEVLTLTCNLGAIELPENTLDHLPSHDVGRFVDADLSVNGTDPALKPALAEVVSSIKPPTGLFVIEDPQDGPVAVMLCVQDNDLAGIMSLSVRPDHQNRGLGLEILTAALRWARMRGAKSAWLQVVADNAPALALYSKLGFTEAYRYAYWRKASKA